MNGTVNFAVGITTALVSIGAATVCAPIDRLAIFISRKFGVWLVNNIELGLCLLKGKIGLPFYARNEIWLR